MEDSKNWVKWITYLSLGTCPECFVRNGKIYSYDELKRIGEPRLHPNCKCRLERLKAILAGEATQLGIKGADWWLKYLEKLPDYYISKSEATQKGWKNKKGNLSELAPGKMIGGGIYKNKDNVLPRKEGRVWKEVDINYFGGYRNKQRLVYSNDGLIFVTYDHYFTFAEIIGEEW